MWFTTLCLLIVCTYLTNDVHGDSCIPRQFDSDSVVCVCNSTYCDSITEEDDLLDGQFLRYESNIAGSRYNMIIGNSNETLSAIDDVLCFNTSYRKHHMHGFGGSFTDAAGLNILLLSDKTQDKLMESYFSEGGNDYNLGRVPIGGSDFSTRPYTYDDNNTGDTTLEKFSLQYEDYYYKIPFMQLALEMNPDLKFTSNSWSPPAWMKTNNKINGENAYLKREYYQLYADYHIKFLDEYEKHNLTFWMISPGNEPQGSALLPELNHMLWPADKVTEWIAEYYIPTIKSTKHNTSMYILDDQRYYISPYVQIIFENTIIRDYVIGIGLHWYLDYVTSEDDLDIIHKGYPEKFLLMTEACVGSMAWENPKVILGSWLRGEVYVAKMFQNLRHWVTGWIDWNLVLDKKGGPNWIHNNVDAPIIVNPETDEFFKQPLYYVIGHFSKFVPRGSVNIDITDGPELNTIAFERPDKKKVIILQNVRSFARNVHITDENGYRIHVSLSARSINTIIL